MARAIDTFTIRSAALGVGGCAHAAPEFALVTEETGVTVTGWFAVVEVASSVLTTTRVRLLGSGGSKLNKTPAGFTLICLQE